MVPLDWEEWPRWRAQAQPTLASSRKDLEEGEYALKGPSRGLVGPALGHLIQAPKEAGRTPEAPSLPARYPDAYPEGSPYGYPTRARAGEALRAAKRVLTWEEEEVWNELKRRMAAWEALGEARVYLLGSVARGSFGPKRDIDLLVVSPHPPKDPLERLLQSLNSGWVETKGLTLEEFAKEKAKGALEP
ncbi:nucleotidyltransferase domain-containing protein [Thermus altitudinis]|uniref:nucleotidyltransferase domain-containing protein n=1 Tax=Thermus altitudinis TaxID=2908145 RepID=UPI001FA9750E|nr:nucleotidyltransferase domain-containing protein [Thermus altitudinis]